MSHQNAAEMEARIAQMSRDMEVLAQQNLRLLRRLADERSPEMDEGNEEEESNAREEEDRESRRVTERTQP
jgi:mannose/fructose-specific phosphotransferase system component IIA